VGVLHDLTGPDRDTTPPWEPSGAPPGLSYVVSSTGRSGSGLLCRALAALGQLGAPMEYFNPIHREILTGRWECDADLASYVRALHARRTSREGVFGTKLHWNQLVSLRAEALGADAREPGFAFSADFLEQILPAARYVRIVRLDIDRQAVSLWLALRTGRWSEATSEAAPAVPGDEEPAYDFEGIAACRRTIENGEAHWDRFLRAAGIEPLVVVYENLVSDYEETVRRVASDLTPGLIAPTTPIAQPVTRALADARSEEHHRRFLQDPRRGESPLSSG